MSLILYIKKKYIYNSQSTKECKQQKKSLKNFILIHFFLFSWKIFDFFPFLFDFKRYENWKSFLILLLTSFFFNLTSATKKNNINKELKHLSMFKNKKLNITKKNTIIIILYYWICVVVFFLVLMLLLMMIGFIFSLILNFVLL